MSIRTAPRDFAPVRAVPRVCVFSFWKSIFWLTKVKDIKTFLKHFLVMQYSGYFVCVFSPCFQDSVRQSCGNASVPGMQFPLQKQLPFSAPMWQHAGGIMGGFWKKAEKKNEWVAGSAVTPSIQYCCQAVVFLYSSATTDYCSTWLTHASSVWIILTDNGRMRLFSLKSVL